MVAPVFDATGALRYFVASQLDVTIERHRVRQLQEDRDALSVELAAREAVLVEGEARLALALKAGGLGTWTIDLPDMTATMSATCLENYGRKPDADFTVADFRKAVHPEDLRSRCPRWPRR
ncbi:hypothetical protein AB5I41_28375 [Sphingomonas sp. MMS24-JH45]